MMKLNPSLVYSGIRSNLFLVYIWLVLQTTPVKVYGMSLERMMRSLETGSVQTLTAQIRTNPGLICKFNLGTDGFIDSCNYTIDVVDYRVHPWKLNLGLNSYWLGGPEKDGDGTVTGGFIYADISSILEKDESGLEEKAWFTTEAISPTSARGRCFQFDFSLEGLNVKALSVIRVDVLGVPVPDQPRPEEQNGGTTEQGSAQTRAISMSFGNGFAQLEANTVWRWEDSTQGIWKNGHFSYSAPNPHFFIFEATPNPGAMEKYRGYIALDNIQLNEGVCGNDCNFDGSFSTCLWQNVDGDDFDWTLSRGSRKSFTGPLKDQESSLSSGSAGGYAYIDSGYPRHPGDSAILRLKSEIQTEPDSPLCLVFYVNMYGSGIGSLSLVQENLNNSKLSTLWELVRPASSPRDYWHRAEVTIASEDKSTLFFEGRVGEAERGDIAIDSVSLQQGPCVIKPTEAARYQAVSCSFNSDLCGYISQNIPVEEGTGTEAPPLWSRVKGGENVPEGHGVLSPGEEDWFALFDVKNYQHRPLDRGFLIGPQVPISSDPLCISFWYYMATDVSSVPYLGTLRIMLIPRNITGNEVMSSAEPKIIWSLSNQQEPTWAFAQVSFIPDSPYLLTFEGIRANNVLGVVGIDDVSLYPGSCSIKPKKALVNIGDCSFEFDTCGWRSINPGSAMELRPQDWKLSDRNQNFGSFRDHTFNLDTNGYVYFDTINIQTKTWLISPPLGPNTSLCLEFFYTTTESDSSNLQVKRQFANGTMGPLWGVQFSDLELPQGSTVSTWLHAQVFIPALDSNSAIVFEGNSNDAGYALDDITLRREPCETRPVFQNNFDTRTNPFQFAGLQSTRNKLDLTAKYPVLQSSNSGFFRQAKSLNSSEALKNEETK